MIFLSSDQHFYHKSVIRFCGRPFKDMDHMHETLIANHNSVVGPDDTVYHLGDFSFKAGEIPGILSRLNGKNILLPGNHDDCWKLKTKYETAVARFKRYGFVDVLTEPTDIIVEGMLGFMQHLPCLGDGDLRYPELRKTPEEYAKTYRFLLHGHQHELQCTRTDGNLIQINVGVDQWNYTPVSYTTIEELIKEKVIELQNGKVELPKQRNMVRSG